MPNPLGHTRQGWDPFVFLSTTAPQERCYCSKVAGEGTWSAQAGPELEPTPPWWPLVSFIWVTVLALAEAGAQQTPHKHCEGEGGGRVPGKGHILSLLP